MEIKYHKRNNNNFFILIASVWLFFSCVFIIRVFNESTFYDGITKNIPIDTTTTIGKKIMNIQNTLQADKAIKNQEYEKALQLISGNKSEDYYNRGTIQTLLAYKNALQSNISWLETAQNFVTQAQQNFTLAKRLWPSIEIQNAINANKTTIDTLSNVVDIKTCYGIGQNTIIGINDINTTIEKIKKTLDQEEIYIDKKAKSLPTWCYEKLRYILDTSREQVWLLQVQMGKNNTKYTSDFFQKIENPILCITTPYENIIPSITKGKQWLEEYQLQHINTIEALKNNENIKELCDQSKNDAQVNQKIESAVQELLQKLEDTTWEKNQQQKATDKVEYKDFFNKDEQKILQDIKTTNQSRIDTILHIRGKGNYNPEQYINDMFNQFYGNTWDFIDLHK